MNSKPIRVLQVINDFKKGGIQSEVMWPARIIPADNVIFDVVLFTDFSGYYEDEFSQYGSIYRVIPPKHSNRIFRALGMYLDFFYIKKEIKKLLLSLPKYDAVHSHHIIYNAPCLIAAKEVGVPVRIAHCAVNKPQRREFRDRIHVRLYYWLASKILDRCATVRLGVTQNAADYVFGTGKGRMIKNPTVDLSRFDPQKYPSKESDVISLIMVGSYGKRKNQKFALEVFKELNKMNSKAILRFVGYPRTAKDTYLNELQNKVAEYGLQKHVEFLPQDSDIPALLADSNYLLLPSLQEGLPNVALEAQAMGVQCVFSDDISNDCNCGLVNYLPIDNGAKYWADWILDNWKKRGNTKVYPDMSDWSNHKVCEEYISIWKGEAQ